MTYTVREICERYKVGPHAVLGWIRSGELKAVNVGASPTKKKPRWRITEQALADFEQARTPIPPAKRGRPRKVVTNEAEVMEFYK